MKKILIALFFTTICFSQERILTFDQIDSICLKSKKIINQKFEIERDVQISRKKTIKVITVAMLKIYKTQPLNIVDTESPYEPDNNIIQPEIIKATYEYKLIYNKKRLEEVFVELYYEKNRIQYIKVFNKYNDITLNTFANIISVEKNEKDNNNFSFCENFKYWVESLAKKINNIFYDRKWE